MRKAYWSYINDIIQPCKNDLENVSGKHKTFYQFIKAMKRDHSRISPIKHEGKLATGSFDKAEALNAQFQSVFINEGDDEIPDKGISPHLLS